MKGYVATNNKKFTMSEVERLTREGVNRVTSEDWKNTVSHVSQDIKSTIEREVVLDSEVDQLIIRLEDSSDSSSSSDISVSGSEEWMEGIQPLESD